jgi:hypothetical protein
MKLYVGIRQFYEGVCSDGYVYLFRILIKSTDKQFYSQWFHLCKAAFDCLVLQLEEVGP